MDNRRHHFRFDFPAAERLAVEVTASNSATPLTGAITNLSIGGLAVNLTDASLAPKSGEKFYLKFSLPTMRLTLPADLVHAASQHEPHFGFRFLPSAEASMLEAREKVLWSFLLDAQRRQRRARFAAAG